MSAADQLGFSFRPPERRVWTVRDLVASVRTHIEREYSDAWVEGEISNFRAQASGHLYFTLKDGASQVRSVIFRSALRYLKFKPADGLRALLRFQVQHQALLADIKLAERGRAAVAHRRPGPHRLAFQRLDLDDLGAHVGQHSPAVGTRDRG